MRDKYIEILEKRAATNAEGPEAPDYKLDSSDVAVSEQKANIKDSRSDLGELFANAGKTQKAETSTIKKVLNLKGETDTSSPMLKLAAIGSLATSKLFMGSSDPAYLDQMVSGFEDEIRKIQSP